MFQPTSIPSPTGERHPRWPFRLLVVLLALLILVWPGAAARAAGPVKAWVQQEHLTPGELVQLTFQSSDGSHLTSLDTTPLEKLFRIVGNAINTSITIIDGQSTGTVQRVLTLEPRHQGTLTIPALDYDGGRTEPIAITVTAATTGTTTPDRENFLEVSVEPDRAHVQSQVIVTVRLHHLHPLQKGELSPPEPPGAMVEPLGQDQRTTARIQGRTYQVVERRFAIFPQESGTLTIPPITFHGRVLVPDQRGVVPWSRFLDDRFNRLGLPDPLKDRFTTVARAVELVSESHTVTVLPKPDTYPGQWWLPAREVTLQENWSSDPPQFQVGQPTTRTIRIQAQGVTAAQLPPIPPPGIPGMKLYPDQPVATTRPLGDTVSASREEKMAFVPTRPGTFTLPEVWLHWWDTRSNQPRVAKLPARSFQVLPAAGQPYPAPAPTPAAPPSPNVAGGTPAGGSDPDPAVVPSPPAPVQPGAGQWLWLVVGALAGWLAGLAYIRWRERRATPRTDTPGPRPPEELLPGLGRSCRAGDPTAVRATLLHWGERRWPHDPPRLPATLGQRLGDPAVEAALENLERHLFAPTPGAAWDGRAFWKVVEPALRHSQRQEEPGTSGAIPTLPPLNP